MPPLSPLPATLTGQSQAKRGTLLCQPDRTSPKNTTLALSALAWLPQSLPVAQAALLLLRVCVPVPLDPATRQTVEAARAQFVGCSVIRALSNPDGL